MNENKNLSFDDAAIIIKDAIVRSRYSAAKLVNKELLGLYYAVGKYVSDNSRNGTWGKGAIRKLSDDLQRELPGLSGFSESSIKRMRQFYEEWTPIFGNRPLIMGGIEKTSNPEIRPSSTGELEIFSVVGKDIDLSLFQRQLNGYHPKQSILRSKFPASRVKSSHL